MVDRTASQRIDSPTPPYTLAVAVWRGGHGGVGSLYYLYFTLEIGSDRHTATGVTPPSAWQKED